MLFGLVAVCLAQAACIQPAPAAHKTPAVTELDYALLSLVLRQGYIGSDAAHLVVMEETAHGATPADSDPEQLDPDFFRLDELLSSGLTGAEQAALDDLLGRYSEPEKVANDLRVPVPVSLMSRTDLHQILVAEGWDGFHRRHPNSGGYLELSRPGFNADRTEAILYVAHSCGVLCGSGRLWLLEWSESDGWQIRDSKLLWVS